jgi:catalase
MLQARLMSYADAHLYRLGVNHTQLPVNAAHATSVNSYVQRDGAMFVNHGTGHPNYFPNSIAGSPAEAKEYADPAWHLGEVIVDRFDSRVDHDDYTQAGNLYRLFSEEQKDRLARAIAASLGQTPVEIQHRQLAHFERADPDYAIRVAAALAHAAGETGRERAEEGGARNAPAGFDEVQGA